MKIKEQPKPVEARKVRLNWSFYAECVDCGVVLKVTRTDASINVLEGNKRLVLLAVENACPKCRNIRPA